MNTFQGWIDLPEVRGAFLAVRRVLQCVALGRIAGGINPLVLHGPPGSGKSHLSGALVNEAVRRRPGLTASVLPASDLTPIFEPDANDESASLVAGLRDADLVVLEDLQHLAVVVAEPLVQLLDFRVRRRRQTVVTAIEGPGELQHLPTRLTTRLAAGLVVGLSSLSLEGRRTFLREQATRREADISTEVVDWLAGTIAGSARRLDGALNRIGMMVRLEGKPSTLANVQALFQDEADSRCVTVDRIVQRVGREFRVEPSELQAHDRSHRVLLPRQVGMYLARKLTQMSLEQIGACFGGRDHSTVLHACRKVETVLDRDARLAGVIEQMHGELA